MINLPSLGSKVNIGAVVHSSLTLCSPSAPGGASVAYAVYPLDTFVTKKLWPYFSFPISGLSKNVITS